MNSNWFLFLYDRMERGLIYILFSLVFAVDTFIAADLGYDFDAWPILLFEGGYFMIDATNANLVGHISIRIRANVIIFHVTLIGISGFYGELLLI